MVNDETVKHLAANFDASQLLAALLCHEIPFRLKEIHNVAPDKVEHVKNEIIEYFYANSDNVFDYDAMDMVIASYLK